MSQTGEKSLSNFWRERSDDRVLELVSTLRGADSLIGLMGSGLQVTWSGNGLSYTDLVGKKVALDYGPLQGKPCPFLGSVVDEVIGYAAHEGGHCLFTNHVDEATVGQLVGRTLGKGTAWRRAWRSQRDQIIQDIYRIANILEDAHVDFWVGKKWAVLGEYIRVARGRMKERTPVDLDAIAAQPRPDRDGVLTLWINASLYSGFPKGLPATWDDSWWRERCPTRMSAAVRRAMEYLMGLTRKAVGDQASQRHHWDRFLLALEAVKYLYRFPVPEAQGGSTSAPPTGQGAGGGQGASPSQPQQGQGSKPSQGQAAEGAEDAEADQGQASGEAEEGAEDGAEDGAEASVGQAEGEDAEDEAEASGEEGGEEQPEAGGQGAGKVGNPSASSGQALDDFGPRHRGQVVEIPKALLDQVMEALIHEVEDLSQSVAEVLAERPEHVAAQARKADDDPELARQVTAQVMPQVREIRRVFDRQQDAQSVHLKGLPRGRLDDRRLARVGAGNLNAFRRKEVLAQPDLALGLLLDVSGSMLDSMEIVEQTAAVFAEGLVRKPGVNFAAWCYTGGRSQVDLTRICDRQMGKLHLANVAKGGGTPSGAAIAGVVVLMRRMPERKKVLIHFTDGWPDSEHHVTRAVQAAQAAGIRVYTIGVGRVGGKLQAQYGTGNWETILEVGQLPQAVGRLVKDLDRLQR